MDLFLLMFSVQYCIEFWPRQIRLFTFSFPNNISPNPVCTLKVFQETATKVFKMVKCYQITQMKSIYRGVLIIS